MILTPHSLQQLDENYIRSLDEENVRRLCVTILGDLKEAQERLNQNSTNSSVPFASQPPWFHPAENTEAEEDDDTPIPPPPDDKDDSKDDSDESSTQKTATESDQAAKSRSPKKTA